MFTGIVETLGKITQIQHQDQCIHFSVHPSEIFNDIKIGDSIAVNGVCLTVTSYDQKSFNVTAVPETLRLTNLSELSVGSAVNLERAMKASDRIGGHHVQGHVDTIGKIIEIAQEGQAQLVKISLFQKTTKYLIRKGFVAIDGMSITVIDVGEDWFTVTFIPQTIQSTVVKEYQLGRAVNIEVDMLAKYVEKMIENQYEK